MAFTSRLSFLFKKQFLQITPQIRNRGRISGVNTISGAVNPEPPNSKFAFLQALCMIIPGLFVGATISKYMANFLEENELFVPSDDDDDDD